MRLILTEWQFDLTSCVLAQRTWHRSSGRPMKLPSERDLDIDSWPLRDIQLLTQRGLWPTSEVNAVEWEVNSELLRRFDSVSM